MNDMLSGLRQRKATLGSEYVERNMNKADEFTKPFQEAMTKWCWAWLETLISQKFDL